jgi:hypothetical protein
MDPSPAGPGLRARRAQDADQSRRRILHCPTSRSVALAPWVERHGPRLFAGAPAILHVNVRTGPTSTLDAPPRGPALDRAATDPELIALPAPPKHERTATVAMMLLTAIAALWMAIALFGEARYALSAGQPVEVGELAALRPGTELDNRYVRATGLLGTRGAIRYGRAAESDSFRLAPVAGNPELWVEIRVPEGFEGPRFVPPTAFAGRLVPFKRAGIRHARLASEVEEQTEMKVSGDAWLLIDGSSPRASRWAVALTALFLGFAGWNVVGVARVLRKVKDASPGS